MFTPWTTCCWVVKGSAFFFLNTTVLAPLTSPSLSWFLKVIKLIHELIKLVCICLGQNFIRTNKVFEISEFKLLILNHRDLFREVDVPVQKCSKNIKLTLFIRKVWTVKLYFKNDVLLPIEEILFTSVGQGLLSLFSLRKYNFARPLNYLEWHYVSECIYIPWTFELNERLF